MIDIEQVIEQFDDFIDTYSMPINILGKDYVVSAVIREFDHSYYCKKLDEFIDEHFDRVDDDYYTPRSNDDE